MDFTFTDDQRSLAELAARIVGDLAGDDRLVEALGDAGLLPDQPSDDFGVMEMCLVRFEIGRRAADVPLPSSDPDLASLLRVAEAQGVIEGALELTAAYARERRQFDRPIGSFQAVAHRLADGYIAEKLSWLTLWRAAWLLDEGMPADVELATARLWASDGLHAVGHTCVHVHGGVGIDLDGVAHRYYSASQRLLRELGSATVAARDIGRSLADAAG